ncbi:MAG TPA: glycosyltransferase family A protein [Gemmatimonadaceae bacterium]|nr:glycosyltransferase family A protein [Gemmatimonadaceae bacterium]
MSTTPKEWRGTVTVIVPTHDRPVSLVRLIRVLANDGTTPPCEVLVVADGCTPDTAHAVAAERWPFPVRVLEQQPSRGPAIARNLGAIEARGDVLLFIDDDIEPFGDVVGEHRRLHDGRPLVVIGAPRAPRPRDAGFRELAGWAWWEQQFERMRRPGHRFGYDDVFTGLLSVPRDFWQLLGGFDSSLRCREDFELGLRLVRRRASFVFSEAGGGWHHENRSGDRLVRRKKDEGAADVAIARLHPWAFRSLPLSRGSPDPRADFVRRVAFDWPRLGGFGVRIAERLLDVLEALRMRRAWRRMQGGVMYFAYWRGAAAAGGGWAGLEALRVAAATAEPPERRVLDVDLEQDWATLERRLDETRPDVLGLRIGDMHLGHLLDDPGREPLRGAHLRSPTYELVRALTAARAIASLRSNPMGATRP